MENTGINSFQESTTVLIDAVLSHSSCPSFLCIAGGMVSWWVSVNRYIQKICHRIIDVKLYNVQSLGMRTAGLLSHFQIQFANQLMCRPNTPLFFGGGGQITSKIDVQYIVHDPFWGILSGQHKNLPNSYARWAVLAQDMLLG